MNAIALLLLLAAVLPYGCAILAKAGGSGFDNHVPRAWLDKQQGWRARANAAQQNLFEGLPFYYTAILFALLYRDVASQVLVPWMSAWLLLRLGYVAAYVFNYGALRSLLWALALGINIVVLFIPGGA